MSQLTHFEDNILHIRSMHNKIRPWCQSKVHVQLPFLLVINSNFGRISYVFEILTHLARK